MTSTASDPPLDLADTLPPPPAPDTEPAPAPSQLPRDPWGFGDDDEGGLEP